MFGNVLMSKLDIFQHKGLEKKEKETLNTVFRHYLDNLEFQLNTCKISARFRALGIYSGQFTVLN